MSFQHTSSAADISLSCSSQIGSDGSTTVLKPEVKLQDKEVFDAACMRVAELREFLEKEMQDAKKQDVLFSLHLKAVRAPLLSPLAPSSLSSCSFHCPLAAFSLSSCCLSVHSLLALLAATALSCTTHTEL